MVNKQDVENALQKTRASLQRDGGDVELVEVTDDDVVKVRLKGACGGCPMAAMTLKSFIEKLVKTEVPGVKAVESV